MISSWLVFGLPALILLGFDLVEDVSILANLLSQPEGLNWGALINAIPGRIASRIAALLFRLLIPACVLYILWRGTTAKLHPKR